ncbi:MAG: decaprenyl-phosphate phosphoribosyltransferase [Myxococcota bacterium]
MLAGLLRTMRPHQWVKNLFVVAPLVFAKELFDLPTALRALGAFVVFCLASSTVYYLNDLADVEADRAHPVKRQRPIASGRVPVGVARNVALGMALSAMAGGLALGLALLATVVTYLVLNLAYSAHLKRVPYVDVLSIAAGFELRVLGGAFAALVPPSTYLLVVTFLLATFLGFGKRMHELRQAEDRSMQRQVLRSYDPTTLNVLLYSTATATVLAYVLYTLDPTTHAFFGTRFLAATSPFTAFGVLRFLHLVRNRPEAESPTEEMLRDRPFLANLALWAVAVVLVIYLG